MENEIRNPAGGTPRRSGNDTGGGCSGACDGHCGRGSACEHEDHD